jgi:hypothetical protein
MWRLAVHIKDEDLGHRLTLCRVDHCAPSSTGGASCGSPTSLRLHSTLEPDATALAASILDNLVDI